MANLVLVLGDQLSSGLTALQHYTPGQDVVLMCEVHGEATMVRHHRKKIAFLLSAMRHFAEHLQNKGFSVAYTPLDHPDNTGSLTGEITRMLQTGRFDTVILTQPGEYRVLHDIRDTVDACNVPLELRNDDRFLCSPDDFADWAAGRKQLRMEYFYREMRKKYSILMEGDAPVGGQWNFDAQNRKPPAQGLQIPPPLTFAPDEITQQVMDLVNAHFPDHFGDLDPFYFAVTRDDALRVLDRFITQRLEKFGDYQDAMIADEPWMFHAHISFYLNCGLLEPLECVQAAQDAFHKGQAPLNAVEGFIRQIVGWREFVRGIYWLKMPEYADMNALNATRDLPDFYWSAQTHMNCLRQCVQDTQQNAYAHHIQRLMVLGNFALLAGIDPKQVNEWFLIVYADAFEWVELPNVSGMILYADGGYLASKPYAAGGSYINKMSDYCRSCRYKVTVKNGPEACPFNYLYWDFLDRNRETLRQNPRVGMMYKTLDRMDDDKRQAIRDDSRRLFQAMADSQSIV